MQACGTNAPAEYSSALASSSTLKPSISTTAYIKEDLVNNVDKYFYNNAAVKLLTGVADATSGISTTEYAVSTSLASSSSTLQWTALAKTNGTTANEWNGSVTPQFFCEEYEVVDSNRYFF